MKFKSKRNIILTFFVLFSLLIFLGVGILTSQNNNFIKNNYNNTKFAEQSRKFYEYPTSIAFSPDGKFIASSGGYFNRSEEKWKGIINLWDIEKGKLVKTLTGHSHIVWSVSFSPDGKYLASGSDDNTIKIWEVNSGKNFYTFVGHTDSVSCVYFTYGYVVSGSYDGTVRVWKWVVEKGKIEGREVRRFSGHSNFIETLSVSNDGGYIISGGYDKTVRLWSIENRKELVRYIGYQYNIESLNFSNTGLIALGGWDNNVKILTIDKDNTNMNILKDVKTFSGHSDWVSAVCFSPDEKYIASASYDNTVKLWDVESGVEIFTFKGHQDNVESVCFSPDGKYIASCGKDNTIRLWEIESKMEKKLFNNN